MAENTFSTSPSRLMQSVTIRNALGLQTGDIRFLSWEAFTGHANMIKSITFPTGSKGILTA
jgi:hypothetical protein